MSDAGSVWTIRMHEHAAHVEQVNRFNAALTDLWSRVEALTEVTPGEVLPLTPVASALEHLYVRLDNGAGDELTALRAFVTDVQDTVSRVDETYGTPARWPSEWFRDCYYCGGDGWVPDGFVASDGEYVDRRGSCPICHGSGQNDGGLER